MERYSYEPIIQDKLVIDFLSSEVHDRFIHMREQTDILIRKIRGSYFAQEHFDHVLKKPITSKKMYTFEKRAEAVNNCLYSYDKCDFRRCRKDLISIKQMIIQNYQDDIYRHWIIDEIGKITSILDKLIKIIVLSYKLCDEVKELTFDGKTALGESGVSGQAHVNWDLRTKFINDCK